MEIQKQEIQTDKKNFKRFVRYDKELFPKPIKANDLEITCDFCQQELLYHCLTQHLKLSCKKAKDKTEEEIERARYIMKYKAQIAKEEILLGQLKQKLQEFLQL